MHGWLYLKPRVSSPPIYDIIYGNMIAAGIEFDRYRTLARVSPLPTILRGYLALSPRVTTATQLVSRTTTVSLLRTPTTVDDSPNPPVPAQSYSLFSFANTNTNANRVDRNQDLEFTFSPFWRADGLTLRQIPHEIGFVKL